MEIKAVQAVMEKNKNLIRRNLAAFLLLSILLAVLACSKSQESVTAISSAVMVAVIVLLICNFIGVFKRLYSKEEADLYAGSKRYFAETILWMWAVCILAYCIVRVLGIVGTHNSGVNALLVNDINQMAASIQNNLLNGIFYFAGLALWIALAGASVFLANHWSRSKSLEHFRGLAAAFLTILLIAVQRFAVKFISALVINALGGVARLFEMTQDYAVVAVITLENLLLVLFVLIDLALVRLWIRGKQKRKEVT